MEGGIVISLAMVIAAVLRMVVGYVWYSPLLFGKQWMRLTAKDTKSMNKKGIGKLYALEFLGGFVMAFMLGHIVTLYHTKSLIDGATIGLWIGIAFVLTTTLGDYMFNNRPRELYFINNGYQIISLILMGIVLAKWG